jgi:acyl carrier protein
MRDAFERLNNSAAKLPDMSSADGAAVPATRLMGPRTATERVISDIWKDVLGSSDLSIHDDFFELGGSSLLVARVMSRVNETYRINLPLLTLLESPTVAELAGCVEAVCGHKPLRNEQRNSR